MTGLATSTYRTAGVSTTIASASSIEDAGAATVAAQ
jgi:hypothetical protein